MLFLLGLILPIACVPGYFGEPVTSQWIVLSLALPIMIAWKGPPSPMQFFQSPLHILLTAFALYVCFSVTWAHNQDYEMMSRVWPVAIWLLAFWYGSISDSLTWLWRGLALGLAISSLIALAQFFGLTAIPVQVGYPGLFFNPTLSGAICALVLVALRHQWQWMPGPALGLVLSGSRGAWLVLAASLACRYVNILAAIALLIITDLLITFHLGPTDSIRLQIWVVAYRGLTWLGWGPDSFNEVFFQNSNGPLHAGFTHNDYLQLAFEYGLGASLILIPFALGLTKHRDPEWLVLFAYCILALFWFPLYTPITAFIGLCTLGHISRRFTPPLEVIADRIRLLADIP